MEKKAKKVKKPKSKAAKIVEGVVVGLFAGVLALGAFFLISGKITASKSENKNAPTPFANSYLPILVLTDSMEPVYNVDTAIFVKKVSPEEIVNGFKEGFTYDLTFYDKHSVYPDYYTDETVNFLQNYKNPKSVAPTLPTNTTVTHRLFHIQVNEDVELGQGKYFFFVEGINTLSEHQAASNQYQVFNENELYGYVTGNSNFVGGFYKFVSSPWGLIILLLVPSLYMIISSLWDLFKKNDENEEVVVDGANPLEGLSKKDQERLKEELLDELLNKGANKNDEQ